MNPVLTQIVFVFSGEAAKPSSNFLSNTGVQGAMLGVGGTLFVTAITLWNSARTEKLRREHELAMRKLEHQRTSQTEARERRRTRIQKALEDFLSLVDAADNWILVLINERRSKPFEFDAQSLEESHQAKKWREKFDSLPLLVSSFEIADVGAWQDLVNLISIYDDAITELLDVGEGAKYSELEGRSFQRVQTIRKALIAEIKKADD